MMGKTRGRENAHTNIHVGESWNEFAAINLGMELGLMIQGSKVNAWLRT